LPLPAPRLEECASELIFRHSLARMTTSEAYTPMRPLVMDFRTDPRRCRYRQSVHVRPGITGESGDCDWS
jgi:hypothetical protein